MAIKIEWTNTAIVNRKKILEYYIKRNKSKVHSNKLNALFNETVVQIQRFPKAGKKSSMINIRGRVISNYIIIYKIYIDKISILRIWDTRQNPIIVGDLF